MPPKPRKQQIIRDSLMHRRQRIQQMKSRNRPPRPMRLPILMRQDQRRPPRPVHHPRSQNPQHAPMPLRIIQHNAFAACSVASPSISASRSSIASSAFGSVARRSLFSPSSFSASSLRPRRVLRQKQLDDIARNVHPPRSIDPRSQPKPNLRRARRRDSAAICATSIRARSPGCTGFRSAASPSAAITRFSPSSGTESAIVAIATSFRKEGSVPRRSFSRCLSVLRGSHQNRLRQLERHPRPAQLLERIPAPAWAGFSTASASGTPCASSGR